MTILDHHLAAGGTDDADTTVPPPEAVRVLVDNDG